VHERLLVAEDDSDFRALLASALRTAAYEVVEVSNGFDLIEILRDSLTAGGGIGSFDLVLSNFQMPGWTGLDVLASLGHGPSLPPVILITAFGDDELRRRAKSAGAVTVLFLDSAGNEVARLVGQQPQEVLIQSLEVLAGKKCNGFRTLPSSLAEES
jgi:CheY-like chemotaxis protein